MMRIIFFNGKYTLSSWCLTSGNLSFSLHFLLEIVGSDIKQKREGTGHISIYSSW